MKKTIILSLLCGTLCFLTGCETFYNLSPSTKKARQQQNTQISRSVYNSERAIATAESAEAQISQIEMRLNRLESMPTHDHEIATLRSEIASLRLEMRNDRNALKKEIINELSGNFAQILKTQNTQTVTPKPKPPKKQTGYDHIVTSGQTLSEIAKGYGVSISKIKEANNLKSDNIRVGQKLFIPD